MSIFYFSFLGPVELRRDGKPIELTSAKAIALLAYLTVTDLPHTRTHLADLLWPDSLPDAARKNLRNTLWSIRSGLGEEALQSNGEHISLLDVHASDVEQFEAMGRSLSSDEFRTADELRAVVDLFRAPLLEGVTLTDAPDFEVWLTGERERLGRLYLRMLDRLVVLYRAGEEWEELLAVARRGLAHDNLQEPMAQASMEAYARMGNRAEALRQYDRLHAILERELGVEPLPETKQLRADILDGKLALGREALPSALAPRTPAGDRVALPPVQPFVGRRKERAALDSELELVSDGRTRIVLITGELGIGKSRLWQEWSATLSLEITVLETRCLDTTQPLPFAPLTGLFRQRACMEALLRPAASISPVWLAELARLLPELRQHWPQLPEPIALPAEEERHRLFEAFTQILSTIESRPLILFFDDLHWADQATLNWLVYFADRMSAAPLLLVGAFRDHEASEALVHLTAGWTRSGIVRSLRLERLTIEESTELVETLGGDRERAIHLQDRSAGNPYFLLELNRSDSDDTPRGLVELVRNRIRSLSEIARQILQTAAVLQTEIEFDTLRRTSGRGEEETLDALDRLLDAAILDEDEGMIGFGHPLVATIVHDDLTLARRSFLHRRAAEALETTHGGRLASVAGRLLSHFAEAGRTDRAAHYAELAANHAMEVAAYAEAEAFFQRALQLEPTPGRLSGLARAILARGDLPRARAAYQRAVETFREQADDEGAAQAALSLAESYLFSGEGDRVVEWAQRARSFLGEKPEPQVLAHVHHLLGAGGLLFTGSLAEAETHMTRAAQLAKDSHSPSMAARSQFELGNALAQRGDLNRALPAFEQAIRLAQEAGDRAQLVLSHNNLAYHALLAGKIEMASEHLHTGMALAETHEFFLPWQYLFSTQGEIALAQGELDEAETAFQRALAEAEQHGNRSQAANIQANLGLVAQARGDLDRALVLLSEAAEWVSNRSDPHLRTQIALWLSELYLARKQRNEALSVLQEAESLLDGSERLGLLDWAHRLRDELG